MARPKLSEFELAEARAARTAGAAPVTRANPDDPGKLTEADRAFIRLRLCELVKDTSPSNRTPERIAADANSLYNYIVTGKPIEGA